MLDDRPNFHSSCTEDAWERLKSNILMLLRSLFRPLHFLEHTHDAWRQIVLPPDLNRLYCGTPSIKLDRKHSAPGHLSVYKRLVQEKGAKERPKKIGRFRNWTPARLLMGLYCNRKIWLSTIAAWWSSSMIRPSGYNPRSSASLLDWARSRVVSNINPKIIIEFS